MSTPEREVTYREAIRFALRDAMLADDRVLLLGEDIGAAGGVFKVTEGLFEEFGANRVMDTPISETAFVGASIGLALAGFKPVTELMFADFAAVCWDQIVNQAAKYLFLSAGQMSVPMVIRSGAGAGLRFGAQHSQTTESWFLNIPGLKVVAPSNPQDAYGLMMSALNDGNPVIYLEHKKLYTSRGQIDPSAGAVPIGVARVVRPGSTITMTASLAMVQVAEQAAVQLADEGIDVELIDVRSLVPLDVSTIAESVRKTSRLVTVEEQPTFGGWGSQLVAEVVEVAFDSLDAPPVRVGAPWAPTAYSPVLEDLAIPSPSRVVAAVRRLLG